MNTMVIDFSADGVVQGMHRDGFSLGFLGNQSIERASEIVFDEASQLWDIKLPCPKQGCTFMTHPHARGFHGYEEARKIEVQWLDACRLAGVEPFSMRGSLILTELRKSCHT